ncbi:MAG: T9SS type A sorting domain-containing protein [Calditrichaeota bacterium]|nr:T9SS type A sorting domain-containing protein [Calditrichota bacterium]
MSKHVKIAFFTGLIASVVQAQPEVAWERTYGGAGGQYGESMVVALDGGYALAGSSGGGNLHFWIVRLNREGEVAWLNEYDIEGQSNECYDLCNTDDGGFLLVGMIRLDNAYGWHIMRIEPDGDPVWRRTFFAGGQPLNWATAVIRVKEEEYVVCGGRFPPNDNLDAMILKINGDGDVIWEREAGGDGNQMLDDITLAPDSYVACGFSNAEGSNDFYLIKVNDEAGQVVWERTFGEEGRNEHAFGLVRAREGGFAVTGWNSADANNFDPMLLRTNEDGEPLWDRTYDMEGITYSADVVQQIDGGFTLVGRQSVGRNMYVGFALTTEPDGEPTWDMAGGRAFFFTRYNDVAFDAEDNSTLICGTTYGGDNNVLMDVILTKLEPVNHPPAIMGRMPEDSVLFAVIREVLRFQVEAIDIDRDPLDYRWTLNGDTVGVEDFYETQFADTGEFRVECFVRDWQFTVSTVWVIRVLRLIDGYDPVNLNLRIERGESVIFVIRPGPNPDSVGVAWYLDEQLIGRDTLMPITFPETGRFIVAASAGYREVIDTMRWSVEVVEPEKISPVGNVPFLFALHEPYPNPFNGVVMIRYDLPSAADVRLAVFDLSGREVARLAHGRQPAGRHSIVWEGANVASGIYIVRLQQGAKVEARKVVLAK